MPVKFRYETAWNGGTVQVETPSLDELNKIVKELGQNNGAHDTEIAIENGGNVTSDYPQVPGNSGCADALRTLLSSEWGRKQPRTESELTDAMKSNAIHYQRGTISGLLTNLTRKGELRRAGKRNGSYAYAINK